jgi:DNA-binding CsgD family transcriptional regulator
MVWGDMGIAAFTRARDLLLAADRAEATIADVCEELTAAFATLCSWDASAVMTTDPDTSLPTCGVITGFDASLCAPFWDNELLDPDFNKFTQLARVTPSLATLVDSTDGELSRSPRFTKLYEPFGAIDELRVAFTTGLSCLGVGVFVRTGDHEPFTPSELTDVRELLPVATTVLRRALGRVEHATTIHPPVVVILDEASEIRSISSGGHKVLEELRLNGADEDELPNIIRTAAMRARWSRNPSRFATRVQGRNGEWLRVHVSPMESGDGSVAITIEQARPGDLVPILLEAYGLTGRETEVVMYLSRGLSAKEIAEEMLISPHTVRDHIKSVYEKAEVSGRGELLARLFSEHVLSAFHESVRHVEAI